MYAQTWLHKQITQSPLSAQATVRPKGATTKRVLISSLLLTSLVDAFSILVIFLLMNASTGIETVQLKGTKLPVASSADTLTPGVILKIENGIYTIGENQISIDKLGEALTAEKEKSGQAEVALIVQADKDIDYDVLSPVLKIGAGSGFTQYKLAVLDRSAH